MSYSLFIQFFGYLAVIASSLLIAIRVYVSMPYGHLPRNEALKKAS
jgi:hypothetical protein